MGSVIELTAWMEEIKREADIIMAPADIDWDTTQFDWSGAHLKHCDLKEKALVDPVARDEYGKYCRELPRMLVRALRKEIADKLEGK